MTAKFKNIVLNLTAFPWVFKPKVIESFQLLRRRDWNQLWDIYFRGSDDWKSERVKVDEKSCDWMACAIKVWWNGFYQKYKQDQFDWNINQDLIKAVKKKKKIISNKSDRLDFVKWTWLLFVYHKLSIVCVQWWWWRW